MASLYAGLVMLTLIGLAAVYTMATYHEGVEAVRLQWQVAAAAADAAREAKLADGGVLILSRPADVVLVGPRGDVRIAREASRVSLPWGPDSIAEARVVVHAAAAGRHLVAAAPLVFEAVDAATLAERLGAVEERVARVAGGVLDPLFVLYSDVLNPNAYRGFIYAGEVEAAAPVTVRLYPAYPCSIGNKSLDELRVGGTLVRVEYLGGGTWLRSESYTGQHPLVGRIYVYVNGSLVFAGGGEREEPGAARLRLETGEGEALLLVSTGPPRLGPSCGLTGVDGVFPNFLLRLTLPAKGVTVEVESGPVVGFYGSSFMLPSLYYAVDVARLLGAGRLVVLEQPRSYHACSGETLEDKRVIDTGSKRSWILDARVEELDSSGRWRLCVTITNNGPARYIVYRYEGFTGSLAPVIRGSAFEPG